MEMVYTRNISLVEPIPIFQNAWNMEISNNFDRLES